MEDEVRLILTNQSLLFIQMCLVFFWFFCLFFFVFVVFFFYKVIKEEKIIVIFQNYSTESTLELLKGRNE